MRRRSPKPYHVLLFSSFSNLGNGGQESLFQLATRLDRKHFNPMVLAPEEGSLSRRLREQSIETYILSLPKVSIKNVGSIGAAIGKLSALLEEKQIAILHSDGPRNTFYAGVVGHFKKRPLVWHVRSSESDFYDQLLSFLSSKIILVADALAIRFPTESQRAKCITIHNGVDLQRFTPLTQSCIESSNLIFDRPNVMVVHTGRVEVQKGQKHLIEACGRLRDQIPELRIVFAGEIKDGAYFQECLQCAGSMGVRERLRFLGHQENVSRLLQASDIFVMPSIRGEAFSRAILEAMATGKPVVATSCGGAAEAIIDYSSGFIVPPEDSAALAEKIALLATREDLRNQMGKSARSRAEVFFGIEKNLERTIKVYEEVLRSR